MKEVLCVFLMAAATAVARPPALPEPPLPGEEDPAPLGEAFEMLPLTGEAPDESRTDHPELDPLPPADPPIPDAPVYDQMPDLPPLGLPADGEAMPALPTAPGLVAPPQRTAPNVPVEPGTPSQPAEPIPVPPSQDPIPEIPEMEMAKKAYWHPSPIAARRISIEQARPLLIFFASKWDGQCPAVDLVDDLFSQSDFSDFAADTMVLTTVFQPVGSPPPSFSRDRLAAIERFKRYFKVQSFPTIILLDEHGRELERIKGYSRLKKYGRVGKEIKETGTFSTAHVVMQRLKDAVKRNQDRQQRERTARESLTRQGYRPWTSRAGSTLFAKLVDYRAERIILMDERGRNRRVLPSQLILFDAEWARRKQAGLLPPPKMTDTASLSP
jgi:thioredoxin-related protein